MKTVTVRFAEDYADTLDEEAEQAGLSRAEYLRELIEQGREAPAIRAELVETREELMEVRTELDAIRDELAETREELVEVEQARDAAQARADDLREQLKARNAREEDVGELVEYVREERKLQRDRRDFERRRAEAGLLTRTKWWLVGMSDPAEDDTGT